MARPYVWEVDENKKIVDKSIFQQIEDFAATGLTKKQIAFNMGINENTFNAYQERDGRVREAYDTGKAKGIQAVTNTLYSKAKEGDNTAMIFFLKNRDPENWEDVQKRHHAGHDGGAVKITSITREIVDSVDDESSD